MDDLNIAIQFDGTFDLPFLNNGESVRSAGKDSHAVIVKTPKKEIRLELGDWLIRTPSGDLIKRKEFA